MSLEASKSHDFTELIALNATKCSWNVIVPYFEQASSACNQDMEI